MARQTVKVRIFKDAIAVRGTNRQTVVTKQERKSQFAAHNVVHLKSLVAESGPDAGVIYELSDNNKIKYSHIGLSDEAIVELYVTLGHYIKNVINK